MLVDVLAILGLALACAAWAVLEARSDRRRGGCCGGCGEAGCDQRREPRRERAASQARQASSKVSGVRP